MTINIYETRIMLQAINKMLPAQTFLRNTFFPNPITFVTEKVDVDFKKGKRRMAPFVARTKGGIVVDRQGFRTDTYTTPYIAPQRVLTKNDITARMLGEDVYSTRTPEQRAQELLATDLLELDEMIVRREEWFCAQILLTGAVAIKGWVDHVGGNEFVEDKIDFNFTNHETLVGADAWNLGTSNKYGDLQRIRRAILLASGVSPDIAVMANNVAELFLADPAIQKLMDVRNMTVGVINIKPKIQGMDGLTYIGTLTGLGIELYVYDEWFLDDDNLTYPMIPDDYLIMGRTGMGSRLYGAVTQIEKDDEFHTYEGTRIPKVWADRNDDKKMIRVASRPLPKPEDVDSWYTLKVK
ncbi:major capsid protein [Pelotomaculum propionicicum]|uniref:Phage major capsid protein E n=1 Tax=Pelotomaculum propionicicum TaxID=258475 RepID=A0A4Y7RX82_9FIRM|nr:major capsid protein [Pelotomaculum propionicicum]TEB13370.1 hypothetical protein Pmgp_00264 [Pelotomaculum propionicicum]